jgi:cystathionine beta-synthase
MLRGAHKTVLDVIGHTPIVKLNKVASEVQSEIYVKLEYMNPGGSIKERIGKYILERAIQTGDLKPGGTIIEGTSGNTGVGLAMFAAVHGYKCIFVLADKQSQEKIQNLRAFGAKVIVCPTNVAPEDPRSYYSVSKNLAKSIPNSYFVNQYDNPLNAETHYQTTGPEIYQQTQGEFDVFVAGVGTGGTISGTGKYLKEKMPKIKIVGVDIEGSILGHFHKTGKVCEARPYVLEGIGEDIFPANVHFKTIEEGIFCGGSCGAAVVGAIRYAKTLPVPKKILVVLPDSGNRYASKIFNDDWMRENGYMDSTFNVLVNEVLEVLGKGKNAFVSAQDSITVAQAIKLFEKHGISQIPVYREKNLVGVISENLLLRPVFENKIATTDSISVIMQANFKVIDGNQLLSEVADALLRGQIVMVKNNGIVVDILTNSDILNFVSRKG